MIKMTFWIKEKQQKALRDLAQRTEDRVSEHIRRAIDQYLRKGKEK